MGILRLKRRVGDGTPWRIEFASDNPVELHRARIYAGGGGHSQRITYELSTKVVEWFEEQLPEVHVDTDLDCWRQLVKASSAALGRLKRDVDIRADLDLPYAHRLYNYQTVGVAWLAGIKRGILADEPGLGKTIQGLAAADLLGAKRVLIFTVNETVQAQWANTIREWDLGLVNNITGSKTTRIAGLKRPGRWYVASTTLLTTATSTPELRSLLEGETWDVIIVDEAHMLQSRDSKRTKQFMRLKSAAVFLLTGTPVWNKGPSLWSLLHILNRHRWSSEWSWLDTFFKINTTPFGRVVGDVRSGMIDELRAEIAEVMLRRTLSEVHKDLPEARSVMRAIPLTPDLYVEYRNLRRLVKTWQDVEMFDTTVEISSQTQVIHLLRTFLNNPLSRGVRSNPKLDELSRILEEVDGSILVFTWHKEYTEWLANTIPGAEFIHGGVPGPQRADRLNRLRDGSLRILVATMSSIGVGVDLPTVDAVVFMETDWTPAVIEQAWRRIYRVTSSGLKLVYFVFFKSTIEELIVRAFSEKAQLSEELITQAIFKEIT